MSSEADPASAMERLSGQVSTVLSNAITTLEAAPKERFFPSGINEIYVSATFAGVTATVRVSGVTTSSPLTAGDGGVVSITSAVYPMDVYAPPGGSVKSLNVSVGSENRRKQSVDLRPCEWDEFELLDGSHGALALPKPKKIPTSMQVYVKVGPRHGSAAGLASVSGVTATSTIPLTQQLTEGIYYLLDFSKPDKLKQQDPWS